MRRRGDFDRYPARGLAGWRPTDAPHPRIARLSTDADARNFRTASITTEVL